MQNIIPLIARCLLSLLFLYSGVKGIFDFEGTSASLANKGIALPGLFAAGGLVFMLVGGLSLVLGYKSKVGAMLLLIFLVPTTLMFHWNLHEPIQLLKNAGLAGGLLFIIAYGAGGWSLDARSKN